MFRCSACPSGVNKKPKAKRNEPRAHLGLGAGSFSDLAHLAVGDVGIVDPLHDTLGQLAGMLTRIVFAMHLLAASEQPIDIVQAATTSIHAHNRAGAFGFIQLQIRKGLSVRAI